MATMLFMADDTRTPRQLLAIRGLIALFVAVGFAMIEQRIDIVLTAHGLSHANILADDVLGGLFLGVIVFLWVWVVDERHRRQRAEERNRLTVEMNHHLRNALTVIRYAAESNDREERVRQIDESVKRIESTLREFLPAMPAGFPPRNTAEIRRAR